MQVQPYLNFDGRCEEAIEFYKKMLGAHVEMLMRYKDAPEDDSMAEGCRGGAMDPDKVMHVCMRIGESTVMAADVPGSPTFQGFSLTLNLTDKAQADRVFTALGEGGQILMPLAPTFFASSFGMVADRFGVSWAIVVPPEGQAKA